MPHLAQRHSPSSLSHPAAAPNRRGRGFALAAAVLLLLVGSMPLQAERAFEAWVHRFDPDASSTQAGTAVAFDQNGNVFVTGYTFINSDAEAFYTAKYDGLTGRALWEKIFDSGNGSDVPHAIVVDSAGNAIVTGSSISPIGGPDYYTIKYDGATGNVLWQKRYDGPINGLDEAVAVAVDAADNVIVAGRSTQANDDIYLIRYAAATGTQTGQFRFTGPQTRPDYPTDMAIDAAGNPVVVGVTTNANGDADIYVAKINLTTETAIWTRTISSTGSLDDEGKGVAIDNAGNVVVTGILSNSDNTHGFLTRKYTSAGAFVWDQTFASPVSDFNGPVDVGVDSAGNAFVTGTSTLDNFRVTFYTAKYAAANGAIVWETRSELASDETQLQNDVATGLVVDGSGNVVVTGLSLNVNVDDDYYTVKYSGADGHILWQDHRNGDNASGQDRPAALAIDIGGNVAVTGISKKADGPYFQNLTVKYGRFLAAERDEVPGAGVAGSGVPEGATFAALFPPAVADNGAVTARVTIADRKKRFSAILLEGGGAGSSLPAIQDADAPGVDGAKFKSFLEPVIAPNGRIAFAATLRGTKGSEAAGVWTTLFTGTLQLALQKGTQVPGLPDGTMLASVISISAPRASPAPRRTRDRCRRRRRCSRPAPTLPPPVGRRGRTVRPGRQSPLCMGEAAPALTGIELVLNRYRPLRPLGSGGSGSVWLARDERTGLDVALKIVAREGKSAMRAEREAKAAAHLRHPACLRAYGFGRDSRHVYIAYEFVPGQTYREALRAGELTDDEAIEACAQVCDGLAHAHAAGILHRDVKPSNVLLADGDRVSARVLDFGLAQMADAETLTEAGDVPGNARVHLARAARGRRGDAGGRRLGGRRDALGGARGTASLLARLDARDGARDRGRRAAAR